MTAAPLQTVWTVTIYDHAATRPVSTWSATTKQKALSSLEEDYGADLPELIEALAKGESYWDGDQHFVLTESTLLGA